MTLELLTERDGAAWLARFYAFQAARGHFAVRLGSIGRDGEVLDGEVNLAKYWTPREVRSLFERAAEDAGISAEAAGALLDAGRDGRLRMLASACRLCGYTAAGRAKYEALEAVEAPPDFWRWIQACLAATRSPVA